MQTEHKKILWLLLAGVSAYTCYLYSKMSQERKDRLWVSLKETGKNLVDGFFPDTLKDKWAKNDSIDSHPHYGKVTSLS